MAVKLLGYDSMLDVPGVDNPLAMNYSDYSVSWRQLLGLCPELREIQRRIRLLHAYESETFCANLLWYGDAEHRGIKAWLSDLIGWRSSSAIPIVSTAEAYDVGYHRLYKMLPDCWESCSCLITDRDLWAFWESTAPGGPPFQRSVVYFAQAASGLLIKIGYTTDLKGRLCSLRTGSPVALQLIGSRTGSVEMEKALHRRFAKYRQHGEWFLPAPEILEYIEVNCQKLVER